MQAILSGEHLSAMPETLFSSPSLPIDARVSDKVRGKIWNNEFIDFGVLLPNPITEGKFQITISSGNDNAQTVCLEPVAKTKKILSLDHWLSALHVFVGVYTQKYPSEAPALMKYGEVIKNLAARGCNWRFYNENFRFLRQTQPSTFKWSNIHWELWMTAQQKVERKAINPTTRPSTSEGFPKGYCFKFIKGTHCSGCNYKN